ncbi:MAG: hypothetical protein AAF653_21835, partial [Chloroflexota bacterium]
LHYPGGEIQRTCSRIPTFAYLLAQHTVLGMIFPAWRGRLADHHWYRDENFTREHTREVEVLPGSCLLMRREDILLNGALKLYFPEDDLAQRFRGRRFYFLADAKITHREKSSTHSWLATRIYFEDMLIYTRTHHGWWRMALLWLLSCPLYGAMWVKAKMKV